MDYTAYYDDLIEHLEGPYLKATDIRVQSGFRGDTERWGRARRSITTPMIAPGSWLDIGCARHSYSSFSINSVSQ